MFDDDAMDRIGTMAEDLGVQRAALLAVAKVESNGRPFARVKGADMPLIRWEGHYFFRELPGSLRDTAVRKGLAAPGMGVVKNPQTQESRYNLLGRAEEIHEPAALRSCSWGLGQVMGANAEWIGYASVQDLVADAKAGVAGQVAVMARFIRAAKLVDELVALDWAAFARQYNGKSYKVNRYDIRMAEAFKEFGGTPVAETDRPLTLKAGSEGSAVTDLQTMLRRAGYSLIVDGDFGPATKAAVIAFQRDYDLVPDGVVGPKSWAALESVATSVD